MSIYDAWIKLVELVKAWEDAVAVKNSMAKMSIVRVYITACHLFPPSE